MKYKGYILLAVTILMFSTLEVVTGTIKNLINPLQLTFLHSAATSLPNFNQRARFTA